MSSDGSDDGSGAEQGRIRFNEAGDYEDGQWIGGEFFGGKERKARRMTKDEVRSGRRRCGADRAPPPSWRAQRGHNGVRRLGSRASHRLCAGHVRGVCRVGW